MDRIRVGQFEIDPGERRLRRDGEPIELGARAFDLLLVLAENAGHLVTKATLLERVWPRLVVDENNLAAQVASLRRILGAGAIRTVPGFGYRLELAVSAAAAGAALPGNEVPRLAIARRPGGRLGRLIGREDDLLQVEAALTRTRLVTIVGTAGIGKTRLAEEVLARERMVPADAAAVVPLAAIGHASQVPPAIALATGVALPENADGFAALARALGDVELLLVLDSVEHLAGEIAEPLARLAGQLGNLRLLVTSQAPLGIAGEVVYRLGALPVADPGAVPADVTACPAVALFAERAIAADRNFQLTATNAAQVAGICRRLDGNPFALELAAARIPALGLGGLSCRLDDRFRLLKLGTRSAAGRHDTLKAAFEWSCSLLTPGEKRVFDGLGAFASSFSLEAAARGLADPATDAVEVIDLVGRLVDRSLVTLLPGEPARYRLTETARYYALAELAAHGALDAARAAMAATMLVLLDTAFEEYWSVDEAIWLARYAPEVENVRAAIDWAADHDRALGIALYGSAWPLFVEADLLPEARLRFDQTVRLLSDNLPRQRVGRFWNAVSAFDSTRQYDRARYAAEVAAAMHGATGDARARYYALMQVALNSPADPAAARVAVDEARALEQPGWPARLLAHGAMAEAATCMAADDCDGARTACRRAVRLALTVSERLALAATVQIVELDLASRDTAAALQLGRPLALSLRHSGRHATRFELLVLVIDALALDGALDEARNLGAELLALARRLDAGRLYKALDAFALLACLDGRVETAARISRCADVAYAAHGLMRRRSCDEQLRARLDAALAVRLGDHWREQPADAVPDELTAAALALGIDP